MRRTTKTFALLALLFCAYPVFGQNVEQSEMRDTLEKATISAQVGARNQNSTQTGLIRLDTKFIKSAVAAVVVAAATDLYCKNTGGTWKGL